ncbi:MAG TPA: radical SAM protein [Pyrinomonadaceae bacterium]|jgi:MoaA/NifB/PqqE/SkfB family radical SAM enzyme|nr:radical SAM protein [Pyrinomonadaceae bacterium]
MSAPLFDLFLREGFSAPGPRPVLADSVKQACGVITSYRIDQSLEKLSAELSKGRAPFIIFADEIISISEDILLQAAALLLSEDPPGASFFINSPALAKVYGSARPAAIRNQTEGDDDSGLTTAPHFPSWFCVLNRNILEGSGLLNFHYHTPEFYLLEAASKFAAHKLPSHGVDSLTLEFDARRWAADLVFYASDLLITDFATFKQRHPQESERAQVPPQFRLESLARYVPVPSANDGLARSANEPKISVICPVFKATFLREMLDSVCSQTWENWELLLIVDGPPAGEQEKILSILQNYGAEHRITYQLQKNMGTGPTRARLAQLATGDFVLSLDDDDMLTANALEVFALAVQRYPEARCIRGGASLIGLIKDNLPPRRRLLIDGISNDPFEVTQPFIIERETLESLGGYEWDESLHKAGEDTVLYHKLDQAGIETLLIDSPLYFRRLSTENLTLHFKYDEAMAHFRNLDNRFCPPQWQTAERQFEMIGNFERAITTYANEAAGVEVVCSTKFFQYQTLGDLSDVTIDLEVTSVCNAVCGFCPREVMPDKKTFIAMDLIDRLAGQLGQDQQKQKLVVLCGIGESTLHPQLDQIVKKLSATGAYVAMTTNGSRMHIELFEQLVKSGLISFNFSLNAATAETHQKVMRLKDYDQIVENLEQVLAFKQKRYPHIRVNVSFVVCDLNTHEVSDFVSRWRPRGVSEIWLHPVNNRAGLLSADVKAAQLEAYAELYKRDPLVVVDVFKHREVRDNICKIARSLMFISADGEMRLCAMDYGRKTTYGNLRKKSIQQMHFDKLLSYVRGEVRSLCAGCDFCPQEENQATPVLISRDVRASAMS